MDKISFTTMGICKIGFAIWSKEVPQLDLICQSYFHRGSTGDGRDLTVTQGSNRTCTSCVRQKIGRRKRWGISWVTQMLSVNKVNRCKQLGADWYYNAVFVAGGWYWEKVSPSWCKAGCAKSLGDPSTPLING